MAAAAVSAAGIDLRVQATLPICIGDSILKPAESKKFASVRYNHHPSLRSPGGAKYRIRAAKDSQGSSEELSVEDGDDSYLYSGNNDADGDSYVLVCRGAGKEREMVLERLSGSHEFNLIRTPSETGAAKLAELHPHIPLDEGDEDGLFGDEDDEAPADLENPFDFRHFLKGEESRPASQKSESAPITNGTPIIRPGPASTPVPRPSKRNEGPFMSKTKRKAPDSGKTNPKRVKADAEPPRASPSEPTRRSDLPKVRIDRKASVRQPSIEDDSGELILEDETPVTEKPSRQGAMSLALSGQFGQGPISLRSAASSPASRMESPMPARPDDFDEGEEFEIGGDSSPDEPSQWPSTKQHMPPDDDGDADEEDEDGYADADLEGDEDEPEPSPQPQIDQKGVSVANVAVEDDEDDLDKQLYLAMAEEDEPAKQDESEESEEE